MPRQEKLQTYTGDLTALIHELVFLRITNGLYTNDQVEACKEKLNNLSTKIVILTRPEELLELYKKQNVKIRKKNGEFFIKNKRLRRLYNRVHQSFFRHENLGQYFGSKKIGKESFIVICIFDKTQETLEHELNHFLDRTILEIDKKDEYINLDHKKIELLDKKIDEVDLLIKLEKRLILFGLVIFAIYLHILNLYLLIDESLDNKSNVHKLIIFFILTLMYRYFHLEQKNKEKKKLLLGEYDSEFKKYSHQIQEIYANKFVGEAITNIRFHS